MKTKREKGKIGSTLDSLAVYFYFILCFDVMYTAFPQEKFSNVSFLNFIYFILFSHCIVRGSSYPYMYTLQLHFFPHPLFCCNMSI